MGITLLVAVGAAGTIVPRLRAVHVALSVGGAISLLASKDAVLWLGLETSSSGWRVGAVAAAAWTVGGFSPVGLGLLLESSVELISPVYKMMTAEF